MSGTLYSALLIIGSSMTDTQANKPQENRNKMVLSHLRYVSMPLQSNLKGGVRLEGEELARVTLMFGVLFVMYILLKV